MNLQSISTYRILKCGIDNIKIIHFSTGTKFAVGDNSGGKKYHKSSPVDNLLQHINENDIDNLLQHVNETGIDGIYHS